MALAVKLIVYVTRTLQNKRLSEIRRKGGEAVSARAQIDRCFQLFRATRVELSSYRDAPTSLETRRN